MIRNFLGSLGRWRIGQSANSTCANFGQLSEIDLLRRDYNRTSWGKALRRAATERTSCTRAEHIAGDDAIGARIGTQPPGQGTDAASDCST